MIKKIIKNLSYKYLYRKYFSYHNEQLTIEEFDLYFKDAKSRALIVYRTSPVVDLIKGLRIDQFSSDGAVASIVKSVNQLGYLVDVIDWDNIEPSLKNEYDLIIIHGAVNYKKVLKNLKSDGKIIYYSTGSYWQYHNSQEAKRYKDFNIRHKSNLAPDRKIENSEEEINRKSDLIISLGNKDTAITYKSFKNVKYLHAASIAEDRMVPIESKNYKRAKKNFLFMSGPGGIHKGLDWGIDYFLEHPDIHLHIMMTLEKDFEEFYHDALYSSPNIHYYGYVKQRSKKFYEVTDLCASSILFSCSEGSPGSVIESMHQGLVPIVTKESHIDVEKCGIIIDRLSMQKIDKAISSLLAMSENDLKKKCFRAKSIIENEYTVSIFEDKFKSILKEIKGQTI